MNTIVTSNEYSATMEAETALIDAMRRINQATAAIRCNCHIFAKDYPLVLWDLERLIRIIDDYKLTEE